jgi:hypothetical protein
MLVLAGFLLGSLALCGAVPSQSPLSAEEVMRHAVDRAGSPECGSNRPDYEYRKHTVTEEIDKQGRLKQHKEKLYDVLVQAGLPSSRLLQINGQILPPAALKRQQDHDAAERAKLTDSQPGRKSITTESLLTSDLVAKYKLALLAPETVKDRLTYVISFEPKSSNLPITQLTDRFANHMAGTVWIDAEDFELVKADIHLQGEVELWGGILGTLRRCEFTLLRTRLPDGVWFDSVSHGIFEGRRLLEPLLIKTISESSNFRRLALARN